MSHGFKEGFDPSQSLIPVERQDIPKDEASTALEVSEDVIDGEVVDVEHFPSRVKVGQYRRELAQKFERDFELPVIQARDADGVTDGFRIELINSNGPDNEAFVVLGNTGLKVRCMKANAEHVLAGAIERYRHFNKPLEAIRNDLQQTA